MSTETKNFYRRLSQLLCEKSDVSYSDSSAWVKWQISFSLLRTSIICIRGSWSKKYNIPTEERMDIDAANRIVENNQKLINMDFYTKLDIYTCMYIMYL